jgi:hypothetical protein
MKVPSQLYYLLSAPNGLPTLAGKPALVNPNVEGFRWRSWWAVVQPTAAGAFDWSTIDSGRDLCEANGKRLGLSVACGDATPQWVYDDEGVEEFIFDPLNEVGSMPIPWDPLYLPLLYDLIEKMGAKYDLDPVISYVVVSGFMQHFEGYLAKTTDETDRLTTSALAYSFADLNDAWQTTGKAIMDAFATAFPNTAVLYTSARPFVPDPNQTEQKIFREWIKDNHPGHAGWMTAQLHAAEGPWTPTTGVTWPHGYQAIFQSGDLERFYGAGNVPVPDPVAPQMMIDFINNGLQQQDGNGGGAKAQFIEVYGSDMDAAANQSTFDSLRPLLVSFTDYVPPGDTPPPDPVPTPDPVPVPVVVPARYKTTCDVGTHARNIILGRKVTPSTPPPAPVRPGPVELLNVTTPNIAGSGTATATWLSPAGIDPALLVYRMILTGGPGTITIVSQTPV